MIYNSLKNESMKKQTIRRFICLADKLSLLCQLIKPLPQKRVALRDGDVLLFVSLFVRLSVACIAY